MYQGFLLFRGHDFLLFRGHRKIHSFLGAHWKLKTVKYLEEDNKHLKHMLSTSEGQKKLFLIEIKPLIPFFKIKFIEIYLNEVKLIYSIKI